MTNEEKAIELTKAACMFIEGKTKHIETAASLAVDIYECVLAEIEKVPEERRTSLNR